MANYLKILLIISSIILISCSKGSDNGRQLEKAFTYSGLSDSDVKYRRMFDSIYINLAIEKSRYDEAINLFLRDINIISDKNLFKKITEVAIKNHRFLETKKITSRWLDIEEDSFLAHSYGIMASLEISDFDNANLLMNSYLSNIGPKGKSAYRRLMFSFLENKNRLNVISFFDNYLDNNDDRLLAISYIELLYSYNQLAKALSYIDEVGVSNERNLVRLKSSALVSLNKLIPARDILISYLSFANNSDRQIQFELMRIHLMLDDMTSTKLLIKDMMERDPDNKDLIFQISRELYVNDKYDISEKYLSMIVIDSDQIAYLRGLIDLKKENYMEAIEHFDRVSGFNIKIEAQISKAEALKKYSGIKSAVQSLDQLESSYSSQETKLRILLAKISLYNKSKLYQEIINTTTSSLYRFDIKSDLLYARAMAYESLGDINLMEKDLLQILSIDKKNSNTLNALGYSLLIHTDRYDEAYEYIIEAYTYDPGNAAIIDSLAWALFKTNNYSEALGYARTAYSKDQDPEIVEHYCEILIKNGLTEEYKRIIEIEFKKNPQNIDLKNKLTSINDNDPL